MDNQTINTFQIRLRLNVQYMRIRVAVVRVLESASPRSLGRNLANEESW